MTRIVVAVGSVLTLTWLAFRGAGAPALDDDPGNGFPAMPFHLDGALAGCHFETKLIAGTCRLLVGEKILPDYDPARFFLHDRVVVVAMGGAGAKDKDLVPVWFTVEAQRGDHIHWEEWVWDIAFHQGRDRAYLVRVSSNPMWAEAKLHVYEIDPASRPGYKALAGSVDRPANDPRSHRERPWAQREWDIPKADKPVGRERRGKGPYTAVRAACDGDELLLTLSRCDDASLLRLRLDLQTKRWLEPK